MNIDHEILSTENFSIVTINPPHVSREDGGHIVIVCKDESIQSYEDMNDALSFELSILARLTGAGLKKALDMDCTDNGIINYQINGNWSINSNEKDPLHLHVYGRSKHSTNQKYGEALYLPKPDTGFYKNNTCLNINDIRIIKDHILNNLQKRKEIIIIGG